MSRISSALLISLIFTITLLPSCDNQKSTNTNIEMTNQHTKGQTNNIQKVEKETNEDESFDMSNPVLMMGTNLGILFKTYYKVGDYTKMMAYTSSSTINKYGKEKLLNMYRNLDFGYDMKLTNMTSEGNEKILHYEIIINATKQVKRLHVVIENDTARVVPQHLERGEIFE
jgi:hypothetical protein